MLSSSAYSNIATLYTLLRPRFTPFRTQFWEEVRIVVPVNLKKILRLKVAQRFVGWSEPKGEKNISRKVPGWLTLQDVCGMENRNQTKKLPHL